MMMQISHVPWSEIRVILNEYEYSSDRNPAGEAILGSWRLLSSRARYEDGVPRRNMEC